MRILTIGDIVGKPGRRAVEQFLPDLFRQYKPDFVIANGENCAGGLGLTPDTLQELLAYGIDVVTTGNHIWAKKEIIPCLSSDLPVLRPLNFPPGAPGRGYITTKGVTIVNLIGRVFVGQFDCPFRTMDSLLSDTAGISKIVVIDFHAEATSEKVALGRYLDGRASAVLGTHTHVGTIDAHILPKGTAYVSDIGMAGPIYSVIGVDTELAIQNFVTGIPHRFAVGDGPVALDAILVDIDDATGKAKEIQRIRRSEE